jgi:membrane protease YdiL (CAAX protease family)
MGDKQRHFKLYNESPLYQLFVSLLIIMGVGITLSIILILAGTMIFGSDLTVLEKSTEALRNSDVGFLKYILIIQDISLFLVPSIIILVMMKPGSSTGLSELKIPHLKETGLVIILALCILPVTSFTEQINAGMHLPEWLSGVEKWMVEKEDHANNIINQVMVSPAFGTMILNLFIIAILPALAEEILFRGVLQKILYNLFKSGHVAIWVTAFIFSTIHFQFFGFIPRFILGLVFGYLFFWSGTLWLPVISHFVNNAVPVVVAYIQGMEKFDAPVDTPLLKQAIALPLPILISLIILFYFRNNRRNTDGH